MAVTMTEDDRDTATPELRPPAPRRVLVLSADMGGGHNATATALEEAVQRLWPGSESLRLDALDVMGPGIGRLFRGIYVSNVETTPWLYEFFYANLWRHRWFANASKRFTGSWCGRRLVTHIDRFDPDLILSTYPLGSAGLAWLRRHRGLSVPAGCWVSDFAPHPFWVYSELDGNFVMHESALSVARVAAPGARAEVSAPPVAARFADRDMQAARERLRLRPDALVVLVSCGSYAFGDVRTLVEALVSASPDVQVVAACGRNTVTYDALERMGLPDTALTPVGWTDEMATLVDAADLVVTNAGGATALEALACATPVVTTSPIAAHGEANAALMTVAGLTELCATTDRLRTFVATAARDRSTLDPMRERIRAHLRRHDVDGGLRRLATLAEPGRSPAQTPRRPWPMRPADAFFRHVEDGDVRQELGAVLELEPLPDGCAPTLDAVADQLQSRVAGLPPARRALAPGRPGWLLHPDIRVRDHLSEHVVRTADPEAEAWRAVGDLWSQPLQPGRPAWEMRLVHGLPGGRSLLAVKLHHCAGDGISALGLMDRLLDTADGDPLVERRPSKRDRARQRPGKIGRGLWRLATRGRVPDHGVNRIEVGGERDFVAVPLPWQELRRLGTAFDAGAHEAVIALVADALGRLLAPRGLLREGRDVRAMVPVAVRAARLDRVFGNWTGAIVVDLPTGDMPWPERVARVRTEIRRRGTHGEAEAAAAVMYLAGKLPARFHRWCASAVYNRRFFNTIVSYMPAARGSRWCAGARVRAFYPVLPLTHGVPLTVGIVVSDGVAGVGVLLDRRLGLPREAVEEAVRSAFTEAAGGTP